MYYFKKFIIIIFVLKYSYSYRLKTNFNLPSTLIRISKRNFNLNSEPKNDVKYGSRELTESDLDKEDWLMDLNEKNVQGVLDLIRNQLAYDGGGIELNKIVDNEVYVTFTGACVGCPYRSTTLKDVVENNLTKFLKSPNQDPICVKVIQDND